MLSVQARGVKMMGITVVARESVAAQLLQHRHVAHGLALLVDWIRLHHAHSGARP